MQCACHAPHRSGLHVRWPRLGAPVASTLNGTREMPERAAVPATFSFVRFIAVCAALATAAAALFAVGAIAIEKTHGLALVDVLTAPIAVVVYGGPPLLALGLAARAQTGAALAIGTVLVAVLAVGLVALGGAPWQAARWQMDASDAQTRLLLGTLFGAWPLTIVGTALWRPANREPD